MFQHVVAKALLPKAALLHWSAPGLTLTFMFIKSLCEYEPHELLNNLNNLFPVSSFIFHIFHTFITMKVKGQDPILACLLGNATNTREFWI
jgi:hypothetical protein